jgi:DNA-binding XRE family transcriptional regulator
MKFIIILRNPVDRALSSYFYQKSQLFHDTEEGSLNGFRNNYLKEIKSRKEYENCMSQNLKSKNYLLNLEKADENNTKKRDELEAGYEAFRIGAMIHNTRIEMGMTQEQLADKVGTSKSYISKIENDIKEARLSTLQKIIELGFGGKLELNIRL